MKRVKWILAIATTLTSLSALAGAQNYQHGVVAQVPFEFKVGNTFVSAGHCEILTAAENPWSLTIRNLNANMSMVAWASPRETSKAAGDYALIFNRYGDQYFLTAIRIQGSRESYKLPEGKAEKELLAQNRKKEEVLVASLK